MMKDDALTLDRKERARTRGLLKNKTTASTSANFRSLNWGERWTRGVGRHAKTTDLYDCPGPPQAARPTEQQWTGLVETKVCRGPWYPYMVGKVQGWYLGQGMAGAPALRLSPPTHLSPPANAQGTRQLQSSTL